MDSRTRRLTKALQTYDSKLYAERDPQGVISVYRKNTVYDSYEYQGQRLLVPRSQPFHLFPLTDTWNFKGRPVDWGVEPLMFKIRWGDLWNHETVVEEFIEQAEKDDASKERHFKNQTRAFLSDHKSMFQKAFNDINTANLDKKLNKGD